MLWCRLYSDIMTVPCIIHHSDEFEEIRSNGLTITQSSAMILYKYYPKWKDHADKMIQYK